MVKRGSRSDFSITPGILFTIALNYILDQGKVLTSRRRAYLDGFFFSSLLFIPVLYAARTYTGSRTPNSCTIPFLRKGRVQTNEVALAKKRDFSSRMRKLNLGGIRVAGRSDGL